jgi:hypothetical protein
MAKPKDSSSGVYWNSLTRGPILLKKLGKTHLLNCIKSLVGYNRFRKNNTPYKLDMLLVMAWEAGRRGLPLQEVHRDEAIKSSQNFNNRPISHGKKDPMGGNESYSPSHGEQSWESIGEQDPQYDGWEPWMFDH